MNPQTVPFNRPLSLDSSLKNLQDVFHRGHLSGGGYYSQASEELLSSQLQCPVLLTSSATHALEMMALLLEIKNEDEVIIPSFTYVSTATAFALRGARIRFADCDDFGNVSVEQIEHLVTKRTRAVVVVDYSGTSTQLDRMKQFCQAHRIVFLEDAAAALGATFCHPGLDFQVTPLGTWGQMGCFSFHDTKIITAGEGGALVISDPNYYERALILREKGTNRAHFLRRETSRYTWLDLGSSYSMSELNAAYLHPQIQGLKQVILRRKELWNDYFTALQEPLARIDTRILQWPTHNEPNYSQFSLLFQHEKIRNDFIAAMKRSNVTVTFHYLPLHHSPFARKEHPTEIELPGVDRFSSTLARLPLYYTMTRQEQEQVIHSALDWIQSVR